MVVQKPVKSNEGFLKNPVSDSSTITWSFQVPKTATVRPNNTNNMQVKSPITRQIAINTLAAMHRRYSLPGPVPPHSRPIAEFRASANRSLDLLRQTLQASISKDIDHVIKRYLEKYFVPAVNNIRMNLGNESVCEDQVRAICRAMLDATRVLYISPQKSAQNNENNNSEDTVDSKFGVKQSIPTVTKRKDAESDLDFGMKRRKVKEEIIENCDASSPVPPPASRDPEKWNPDRFNQDTLFIMGSHAHKVLGLGNARGRLYTRHAGLLRYPADTADKEWIASHNLVNAVGGKTYIMVLEDIEELARSEAYKHTSLPMLGELSGFKVPMFMLKKIKAFVMKKVLQEEINTEVVIKEENPQPSSVTKVEDDKYKLDNIKIEPQDTFDTDNFNASQYNISTSDNTKDFSDVPTMKEDTDFADIKVVGMDEIKVDGIKVEDLDEIKVDGIKVEDLEVDDIKVENIDDINVEEIKVEDIKLENDDFPLCKQTDEEQSNLVDGILEADIEFLSRNLGNIESDADARKTIEKLTGANPDTLTLVGDEFDLGPTLNTNTYSTKETKCITVASTTSGMVHSVPVAHITPPRLTGSTLHYYTSAHHHRPLHLPQATVTIQSLPASTSQLIHGIPINSKTGSFSTVMSQGTASTIIGFGSRTTNATIIGTPQYVNVTSKSFPTGNILHNAIVSRNIINRTNLTSSSMSFNVTTVKNGTQSAPKISSNTDFDTISTAKDMIDNACNSSVMLKKVLTLGSAGTKSFMMHNTQKVLSTGFANGAAPPPNVTIVSSGTSVGILNNNIGHSSPNIGHSSANIGHTSANIVNTSGTLSATHATLSALLSSGENASPKKN